ncbi:MAG: class I SAM-dependent DNA methyltransferase, partial [Bacteroidales bacterium]
IQLSQFYGIEIDDFAHEMAILSLWLAEHQMNQVFEEMLPFGKSKPILPLKKAGQIVQGNATRVDWKSVCPIVEGEEVYVIGNPPYLGSRNQNKEQKDDLKYVFSKDYKSLDYISAWFYKGASYIENKNAKCAFVSTNSICQGLLVDITWSRILDKNIEIGFAHQSFKWTNNAKGNAGVTVIIVGIRNVSKKAKYIFSDNVQTEVKNINPYLIDAPNIIVKGKSSSISGFPEMRFGNMPNDGGNLLFSELDKDKFLDEYPNAKRWIKNYVGGSDFIRGNKRFVLWISDNDLEEANKIVEVRNRLSKVEAHRIKSTEKSTREKAKKPNHFYFSAHQETDSIIIPATSSERREYIPIGFLNKDTIISNSAMAIYHAEPWLFAVVTSRMHMVWVRNVGGKLKTDYRYSAKLCYNTFPFPVINTKQKETLNMYVFDILDERAKHPEKTMAQLYNPDTMPKGLLEAHQELDKAIEQCYRLQPFKNDTERLEYLFKMYEKMVNEKGGKK